MAIKCEEVVLSLSLSRVTGEVGGKGRPDQSRSGVPIGFSTLETGEAEEWSDGDVSSKELVRNSSFEAANEERLVLTGDLALLLAVLR